MVSQRSAWVTAMMMAVTVAAALAAPARAGGGYAGIDGSSNPVPTPTYRMFSGQPYYYGVAPAVPTYGRYSAAPYYPTTPRPPIPRQSHK